MSSKFASLVLLSLVFSIPNLTLGGDLTGVITSSKKVKESQTPVVVWIEGLEGGASQEAKPLISQSGIQFVPRVLAVGVGQTVEFPNDDDVAHNVFSLSKAKKFKLGIYPKGDSREVQFESPGVIDLFCSIHRHMHAVIVVAPNNYFAQTKLGKEFQIKNVPEGQYKVKVWNSKHKTSTYDVTVTERGATLKTELK